MPSNATEAEARPLDSENAPGPTATGDGKGVVLCVDDEPSILSSLRRLLRRAGCEVLLAEGGAPGLALLQEREVDVVISDMRMPQMSGAAFLAECATRWPDTVRILLTGYSDLDSAVSAVNEAEIYRYLSKPWNDDDLCLTVREAVQKRRMVRDRAQLELQIHDKNQELITLNEELEARVERRTRQLRESATSLRNAYESIKENFNSTLGMFSQIIEMREGSSHGHAVRVAGLAVEVGLAMGLAGEELDDLHNAALLHDIGKFGLDDALSNMPYGQLSRDQREEFHRHCELGEAVLTMLEPLAGAATITRHHHERFDGQGYPDGLAGESIPPAARILSVVNDYDDLLDGTLVAERYPSAQARAFLKVNAGKRYDPGVVDALLDVLDARARDASDASTRAVAINDLQVGMRLGADVIYEDQIVLLRENQVLTSRLITKLRELLSQPGQCDAVLVRGNA